MRSMLLALALLVTLSACADDAPSSPTEDPIVTADAGADSAPDASRPDLMPIVLPPDIGAACDEPGAARRYVGTPEQCVGIFQTCERAEVTFANACGCGCEPARN